MSFDWRKHAESVIGWTTLSLVLISALTLGANRPVSWVLLSLFVFLLFIAQLFVDWGERLPPASRFLWLVALLYFGALAWGYAQMLTSLPQDWHHPIWDLVPDAASRISIDPGQGRHILLRLGCYAMVFWIIHRGARVRERAWNYIRGIAIFSTLLAIYGLLSYLRGSNTILGEDWTSPGILTASFVNRNSYATYAIFGALANLGVFVKMAKGQSGPALGMREMIRNGLENFFAGTWIFGLGFVICVTAITLTQSRAGAGAGLLALLSFAIVWRGQGKARNPLLVGTLVAVLGFVAYTTSTGLAERLLMTSSENLRFAIYPKVVEGIQQRPWLGHGLGAFEDSFRYFVPLNAAAGEWDMAHNTYLENAYELGLPAAAVFYLALLILTWQIRQGTINRRRDRVFSSIAFGCIIAAAFHSIFDFSLQMPATSALFAAILGIGWTQSFSQEAKSKRRSRKRRPVDDDDDDDDDDALD